MNSYNNHQNSSNNGQQIIQSSQQLIPSHLLNSNIQSRTPHSNNSGYPPNGSVIPHHSNLNAPQLNSNPLFGAHVIPQFNNGNMYSNNPINFAPPSPPPVPPMYMNLN